MVGHTLGSALPVGAQKPGRTGAHVADDEFGGAEPILVKQGGATEQVLVEEEVQEVKQSLTLDANLETFDRASFIQSIAAQYGVMASSITLDVTPGSIQVEFTITLPAAASSASSSSSAASVVAAINAADASTLTAALGVTILSTSSPQVQTTTRTVTRYQEKTCARGFWCTAGLEVPCEAGFFNPSLNANNQSACIKCPDDATTLGANSTSPAQCVCNEGFYKANDASGQTVCKPCFAGTACESCGGRTHTYLREISRPCSYDTLPAPALANDDLFPHTSLCLTTGSTKGVTVLTLPLLRGYYRPSELSLDVRRCPDANAGCQQSSTDACDTSTSGCLGGSLPSIASDNSLISVERRALHSVKSALRSTRVLAELPITGSGCMPGLRGTYCQLCINESSYYVAATSDSAAHCESCDQLLVQSLAGISGVAVGFAAVVLLLRTQRRCRQIMLSAWERVTLSRLKNKLKIMVSFYQVRRAALERSARPLLETWYFLLLGGGVSELTSSRIVINAAADCDAGGDDLRLPPAH